MPRPCAMGLHARNYKPRHQSFADATALCRGASRSQLQNTSSEFCGCHCPVPWSFTLATTKYVIRVLCGCHGLVPWDFTLATTNHVIRVLRMPRPCAVELHARNYKPRHQSFADATALCRGASRSQLQNTSSEFFADATALCRGASRSQLQTTSSEFCGCHGLVPWNFTL